MRRQIALWAALGVVAGVLLAANPASAQVTLNGRQINYRLRPFTIGNFLMVPLDETMTFLGATQVTWEPGQILARFTYQGQDVVIRSGSGYAIVNGQYVVMGVPAVIRQNRLFVPTYFLRSQLGVTVEIPAGVVPSAMRSRVLGFRSPGVLQRAPGDIGIGGVNILILSTPSGYASLADRTTDVNDRLVTGLQLAMQRDNGAFNPRRVTLGTINGEPVIFIAGHRVVTVTSADAAANDTTQDWLALVWLRQMRARLNSVFPAS